MLCLFCQEVCNQIASWQRAGIIPLCTAINDSPVQFAHSEFIVSILSIKKNKFLPPKYLAIEITENVFKHNMESVAQRLVQFREQRVKIFLDDVGPVYSSLAYLRELPLDYIKIDQNLINDLSRAEEQPVQINQAYCFGPKCWLRQ